MFVVDTAGQDEYSIFPAQYAVDIHGYVLVYSIDSLKSFEVIQVLYDKIVDMVGNPKVPVVLVGNKKDLEADREVSREDGEKLAKQIKAVFLETSAKDNFCVTDMFQVSDSELAINHYLIILSFQNVVLQIEQLNGNMVEKKDGCTIA